MKLREVLNRYRPTAQNGPAGEGFYARPIIPLLLAMLLGMIAAPHGCGLRWWAVTVFVVSALWMAACIRRRRNCRLAPLLMFAALGYLSLQGWLIPRMPAHHVGHFSDGQKRRISGIVADRPVGRPGRLRFFLAAEKIRTHRKVAAVTGKIRVTVTGGRDNTLPDVHRGDHVMLRGRIRPIRNFNNPGGFDYKRYMAFKGIRHSTYCRSSELIVLASNSQDPIRRMLDHLRGEVIALISTTPQGVHRGVMEALFVGDRSDISPGVQSAFRRAGVAHLLAISGLHIGIVAAMAFFLFQRLFACVPALLWSAWSRKLAALCAFCPVLLYGGLAGMSPSTQRATLMVLVFLSTFLFEREQDSINTLAAAALAILVASPPALFSISFQLSFAAVFSILYGLKLVSSGHRRPESHRPGGMVTRYLRRGVKFMLISAVATLGTLPLVLLYFNQISLIGIPANCIFIPMIGFVVVPTGLAGVFLAPISATAAGWCMQLAAAVLAPALEAIASLAALPFAAVYTVTPSLLEVTCFYALVWTVSYLIFRRNDPHPGASKAAQLLHPDRNGASPASLKHARQRKLAAVGLALVLTVLSIDTFYWVYQRFWRKDLRITVLDVGQGSAAVLEFPHGHIMLIDGGGFFDNTIFDVGQRIVAPFLWQKKIRTVDTVVLTHPNSDHLNGLIFIADHFHVRQVWSNGEAHTTLGFRKFEAVVARHKILRPEISDLLRGRTINGVSIDILYPPEDFLQRRSRERWRTKNDNSLVLKAEIGRYAFLFPGDITQRAEKELVALAGEQLKSTVLCVPHHGSDSSSGTEFIEAVDPTIGFFCVGWQNRFKFPHEHVLQRYRRRGVDLLRTDRDGAIAFVTDGIRFSVSTYLDTAAHLSAGRIDGDQSES